MMEVDTEGATSERPQGAVIGRVRLINTGTYAIFCSVLYRLEKGKPRNLTWICILGNRSQEGISTPVRVVDWKWPDVTCSNMKASKMILPTILG
jgi:hypothetical protein